MNKLNSNSGFTFIEIIVAVTILSIIVLALYSLMDVGFSFWDYIDKSRWSNTDLQLIVNSLEKDLRSTYYRSSSQRYPFKGIPYQIEFFSREFETGKVKKVLFEYSSYDQKLFIVKDDKKVNLLEEIKQCNFYFFNPKFGYWDNYWDSADKKQLPSMVRLEFTFTETEEQYRYDFPIYTEQKGIGQ